MILTKFLTSYHSLETELAAIKLSQENKEFAEYIEY
jgi:hypothetical protein